MAVAVTLAVSLFVTFQGGGYLRGLGASAKWLQCFLDIFDFSKSSLSLSLQPQ